jgi:hypothetical protein
MNAHDAIKASMTVPDMIMNSYLGDLTDEELLVRPTEGANHIAWQLGHLLTSEHGMIEQVCPGSMPALPDGFAEKYTKETSTSDDSAAFLSKAEYLQLFSEQRAGTLKALDGLSADDLDKPSPKGLQRIGATIGAIFLMQPTHWTMHTGQWAIIRRKIGRPPMF